MAARRLLQAGSQADGAVMKLPLTTRSGIALTALLAILVASAGAGLAFATSSKHGARTAKPASVCARYVSPKGSNRWPGTEKRPFQTVARLVSRLQPGQTGCLEPGATFSEDVTIRRGGSDGHPITLTSPARPAATIQGRLYITDHANHVVISNLILDGRNRANYPSPTVNGDDILFDHDEVTNEHTAICFVLGSDEYGSAVGVTIRASAIHDCGALPATNHDHGIYVEWADGTVITGNAITANADRGIQLFPNAQHTTITHNLIAGNGEGVIFSGDDRTASSDTVVAFNVITDSVIRYAVEEWWPGPVGQRNVVQSNCIGGPRLIEEPAEGFVARDNVVLTGAVVRMAVPGGFCGLPPGVRPGPAQRSG